jgi:hypothetical protein
MAEILITDELVSLGAAVGLSLQDLDGAARMFHCQNKDWETELRAVIAIRLEEKGRQ